MDDKIMLNDEELNKVSGVHFAVPGGRRCGFEQPPGEDKTAGLRSKTAG